MAANSNTVATKVTKTKFKHFFNDLLTAQSTEEALNVLNNVTRKHNLKADLKTGKKAEIDKMSKAMADSFEKVNQELEGLKSTLKDSKLFQESTALDMISLLNGAKTAFDLEKPDFLKKLAELLEGLNIQDNFDQVELELGMAFSIFLNHFGRFNQQLQVWNDYVNNIVQNAKPQQTELSGTGKSFLPLTSSKKEVQDSKDVVVVINSQHTSSIPNPQTNGNGNEKHKKSNQAAKA